MSHSTLPVSSQLGIHPRLAEVVGTHLRVPWQQPFKAYSQPAFAELASRLRPHTPIILDAGCGTGGSTARLASAHPDCQVVGVDQSAVRLGRHPALPANAHLLRAELADFWRLARRAGWRLYRHYLLYPNPWPKPAQLKRRWHAHPVWPELLALGGDLELRSNFEIYAHEFAAALELAGFRAELEVLSLAADQALSPFERKYVQSGHRILVVRAGLGTTTTHERVPTTQKREEIR
ncbi:MAG: tRNA (guanine(46)-N(7))-methyltransferase TrmB [Wenzhouxiangella sp.]